VGVLVICILVFTVFCIVCTVFFVLFRLRVFILICFVVLVQVLLPPSDNSTAVGNNNNNNNIYYVIITPVLKIKLILYIFSVINQLDAQNFVHETATYRCDDTRSCVMQF